MVLIKDFTNEDKLREAAGGKKLSAVMSRISIKMTLFSIQENLKRPLAIRCKQLFHQAVYTFVFTFVLPDWLYLRILGFQTFNLKPQNGRKKSQNGVIVDILELPL